MVVLVSCKYEEDPNKTEGANKIFPIITLWELSVAMEFGNQSSDPMWSKT